MKKTGGRVLVTIVGLLVVSVIVFFATRPDPKDDSQSNEPNPSAAIPEDGAQSKKPLPPLDILNPPPLENDNTSWTTKTITLKEMQFDISYVKYDPPRAVRTDVPRAEINQRTPEDLLEAGVSLSAYGKDEEDFDRIASFRKGRNGLREGLVKYYDGSVEKYFASMKELKKSLGPMKLYGKIKYKNYITLVIGRELLGRGMTSYIGSTTICYDDKYYNISKLNFSGKDAVFVQRMSALEYGIVTGVKH